MKQEILSKKQAGFDKYDDVIVEICAVVDLR